MSQQNLLKLIDAASQDAQLMHEIQSTKSLWRSYRGLPEREASMSLI